MVLTSCNERQWILGCKPAAWNNRPIMSPDPALVMAKGLAHRSASVTERLPASGCPVGSKATIWSWQGLRAAWLHESSFRLEVWLLVVAVPLALWLGDSGLERAVMIGSCLLVLAAELLNSAIEAVIERYGPEHHELAGRAKDMGSAAVFVLMMNVLVCWGLILVPRFF